MTIVAFSYKKCPLKITEEKNQVTTTFIARAVEMFISWAGYGCLKVDIWQLIGAYKE